MSKGSATNGNPVQLSENSRIIFHNFPVNSVYYMEIQEKSRNPVVGPLIMSHEKDLGKIFSSICRTRILASKILVSKVGLVRK